VDEYSPAMANVGGIRCRWSSDAGGVTVEILPASGIEGAVFPAAQEAYYYAECNPAWVCGWRSESADPWVATTFQLSSGMTREGVDQWGALIDQNVRGNYAAAAHEPWTRDRTGWWSVLDCAAVGESVGSSVGDPIEGEVGHYVDPPLPGQVLADVASNYSDCYLNSDALGQVQLVSSAGQAWAVPESAEYTPIDTGVAGISVFVNPNFESNVSASYVLTDGINSLSIYYVPRDDFSQAEALVTAIAQAAATWE
jgi:hypothetical protein